MSKYYLRTILLIVFVFLFNFSCEQDRYEEPEINPKTYSFNFPNRVTFNYSQVSLNRESIIPYSNTLSIKNISNEIQSFEYVIFAFKDNLLNYDNLTFIKHSNESIGIDSATDAIILEQTNTLFTDTNTITSILDINTTQNHTFSGLYYGGLNVYVPSDTNMLEFQRSLLCTGFIDYQGQFNLFIENENESDIVRLVGVFNSENSISGTILNREGANLSSIFNSEQVDFMLTGMNLTGEINFTNDTQEQLLKFNLTKQN